MACLAARRTRYACLITRRVARRQKQPIDGGTGMRCSMPNSTPYPVRVLGNAAPRAPPKAAPRRGRRDMQCSMPSSTPYPVRVPENAAPRAPPKAAPRRERRGMRCSTPSSTPYPVRVLEDTAPRAPQKAARAGACSAACLAARRTRYACLKTRRPARRIMPPLTAAQGHAVQHA